MASKFNSKLWEKLSLEEEAAIELVYKYGEVTTKTLRTAIGRAPKTTMKILHQLVEKDILEWHGTSKTDSKQHYKLK